MKLQDVNYICKLIYESFHIPVIFLNEHNHLEFEFASQTIKNPFYTSTQDLLKQFQLNHEHYPFPLLVKSEYYEHYFIIQVRNLNQYKGMIIVGPALPSELSNERLAALVNDMPVQKGLVEKLVHYYELLPRTSNLKFINISMQMYYMLYQKTLDPANIMLKNIEAGEHIVQIEDPLTTISQKRENVSFHHDFIYEKRLFQYIKEGRKDEFLKVFKLSPDKGELGVLSKKSQLRSSKNLAISAITLATRAAMEGGLQHEIAYTLSDLYIQNLEDLTNMKSVDLFMEQALSDFADRVRKHKHQRYSKPINICINYIYTHLYEDLTLKTLANLIELHPNYLSALFKKEVGISIAEYIHRTKVDEAKSLITFTDYSLLKISTILNFHDQSYFTKVFKKYVGVTPKKYKQNNTESV